jgi:hypothetical protein
MEAKRRVVTCLAIGLILALVAGLSMAAGQGPPGGAGPEVGSGATEQGRLSEPPALPARGGANPRAGQALASNVVWRIEPVHSGYVGQYNSLAFDSQDRPHISYYDFLDDDLEYAYRDQDGWHLETVDYAGYVGAFTSLALDDNDHPHISYCSCTNQSCGTCNDLKYAWHDGDDWHIEWADTTGNVGGYTSLALVDGQPHISYYDYTNSALKYVYKDSGGSPHWDTVDNDGDVGMYTSLAVYAGHRYISYLDVGNQHLKYAHHDGSSWAAVTLDNTASTGYYSSLALCKTYTPGAPRISYYSNGELKYAHKYFFGPWTFVTLDSDPPGPTSLALDSSCQQHIAYFETYNGDLRYRYNGIHGWEMETVDDEGDAWPYWVSLALTSAEQPCMSYYDDSLFGLSYACRVHASYLPHVTRDLTQLTIQLGQDNVERGLALDSGGDVDTEVVWVGSPPTEARRTGNGAILPSGDGNDIPDFYMQFNADDGSIYDGWPTPHLRIAVEYYDQGTDTFSIQYDAYDGGPFGDGRFKDTGWVTKTDTWQFKTAVFELPCDAKFANRDNGADFRIDGHGDGAETIRRVTVTFLEPCHE